jgi:hypothetical protein
VQEELPLFYEAGDRTRFAYALFLLNKDIEQLLGAHGLTSAGPSQLLQNLYKLTSAASSALPPPSPGADRDRRQQQQQQRRVVQQEQPRQLQRTATADGAAAAEAAAAGPSSLTPWSAPAPAAGSPAPPSATASYGSPPLAPRGASASASTSATHGGAHHGRSHSDVGPHWAPVPAFWAGGQNFLATPPRVPPSQLRQQRRSSLPGGRPGHGGSSSGSIDHLLSQGWEGG